MSIGRSIPYRTRIYDESPWYAPLAQYLRRFDARARFPTPDELSALHREVVEQAQGLPALRFVEVPRAKPKRRKGAPVELSALYEGRVIERAEVPTRRDDWHDLFNALAFITFPRAKRALHERAYHIIRARLAPGSTRLPNARTREQDALSLFDEGGLLVAGPRSAELTGADDLTLARNMALGRCVVLPFGHALYEHLVARAPCPLATAHYIEAASPGVGEPLRELDRALAASLSAKHAFLEPSPARGNSLVELAAHLAPSTNTATTP